MPNRHAAGRVARAFAAALLALPLLAVGLAAKEIRVSDRVFLVREKGPTDFQMIVNAGAADELEGAARGIAHYLEHLILVGRNPENRDSALRFFPEAASNGWTNQLATAYTHRIPARAGGPRADLEQLFGFYAARLRGFAIPPEEAARERNVVLQEHDWRYGNSVSARFSRRIDEAALPGHPYSQSVIGSRESIRAMTLDEARAFHAAWYHLNNVWFVVKADIEPDELRAIAEAAFAGLEPRPLPERPSDRPVLNQAEEIRFVERDAKATRTTIVYRKLVSFAEPSPEAGRAAASLLSAILATQLPGSLHERLVEERKLAAGQPSLSLRRLSPGVYSLHVGAELDDEAAPDALAGAIAEYVADLARLDLADRTIERVKRRFADQRRNSDRQPQDVYGRLVGWLAARLDPDEIDRAPGRIQAVSRDDLAALMRAIAAPGRVVVATLAPEPGAATPPGGTGP